MNVKTKKVDLLERIGYHGDSIFHGIGEYVFPDQKKMNLFFVNHIRNASCITIYEHEFGTNQLKLVKNVCHAKILTPNDVTPIGPLQFYITNDHRFRYGKLRQLENKLAPTTIHEIVFCDASESQVSCKTAVSGGMEYPNGIMAIDNANQILVADSISGHVYRYAVNPNNHKLRLVELIKLGVPADNFARIQGSRDVTIAGFPQKSLMYKVVYNPANMTNKAPAYAIRLTPATVDSSGPSSFRKAYSDDGTILSAVTVFVTDDERGVTVAGSVARKGVLFCDHAL